MASGSSGFASMVNVPPPLYGNLLLATGAPHAIIPARGVETLKDHTGMEHFESGSSDQFASWIDGKGPYVPQPLPAHSVPQVVVTSDWSYALRHEMLMDDEYLDGFGPHPAPRIAPFNYLDVPNNKLPTQCHETSVVPIAKRSGNSDALAFKSIFIDTSRTNGCNNCMENGTCIWSDGTLPWSGKSCGITWIAVHGINSICVVIRNEDLEQEVTPRARSSVQHTKEDLLHMFRQGIIHKVEDLADRMFGKTLKKPFGVVSVIQDTHDNASGHETSSAEYDEEKAIKFLEDEMKSNTAFTVNKTVQTAISAFQHLFGQKFKANEIRVILWKEDGDIVKDLPRRDDPSIEEVVAVIRGR